MPLKESVYDVAENIRTEVKHKGFSYQGKIFKRTMSTFMFKEEKRAAILGYIEAVVFQLIEKVKDIKNHVNYVVKKNYRDKN